ncbi:4911_t:CDS:2, partial [Cetraspora pellucida]
LEKMLQNSINQENYIDYLEKQLAIFQNEIDKLNKKIIDLYSFSNTIAQPPGSPRLSLSENQAMIQNNRIHSVTIAPTINGIVDYLNIISDASNKFKKLILDIFSQANIHAINAENQVANLQTQLANLQTQLANSQTQFVDSQNQRITIRAQKRQISESLLEKFALRFKNKQTYQQLQDCKTDGANLRHGAVGQAENIVIPAHTVFDEDWSFADRCPTDRIVNLPNANGSQSIVADRIRLGQAIYWLKTNYLTVTAEKQ